MNGGEVAVLIPCYNEERSVGKVVEDFRRELPEAVVYVYDNNSSDRTAAIAAEAGAVVRREPLQGKGHVVRRMFMEVEAEYYVLVDGDDTYPAEAVHELLAAAREGVDMVCGDRLSNGTYASENKRLFHNFGNNLVRGAINRLFHSGLRDIMTGYRVFRRRFVKNFPVLSPGFEIETEMTLHALDKFFVIREIPILYRDRAAGSVSKLNTISDGSRVMLTIFSIFKDYQPMSFFGVLALIVCLLGLVCGLPPILDYLRFRYVYRVPLSILAAALEMLAINLFTCGLVLDTMAKNHKREYLQQMMGR